MSYTIVYNIFYNIKYNVEHLYILYIPILTTGNVYEQWVEITIEHELFF